MITVGTPAFFASSTGRTSARLSSGASTMPDTPWLVKPSTTCTCCSRSSSRSGPFQMMRTLSPEALSSWAACTAPAWMLFQNSCVVPFGITARVSVLPAPDAAAPEPFFEPASPQAAAPRSTNSTVAESRVVRNAGLQGVEVRWVQRRAGECTGRSGGAAELEQDDALHVLGEPVIAGEGGGHGLQRAVAVRDQGLHV